MTAAPRIALVGLPGSGKSTVAPLVARRLGWQAVDLDVMVEGAGGRAPGAIIAEDGEPAFRDAEAGALEDVLRRAEPLVIACGGGLVTDPRSRDMVNRECATAWLDAPD